ncbi:PREDICTED: uncharacterized protein LOC105363502 [Ceratosolen solmsi marchali]|uniref:Neuroendocrine protein 7B2 n=1 Tax=Ceratosolen solmsi marchali TaxID=326594 RepID=A0AAJ7DX10_9HYME|nr:PREDICTED: uncharacterized protein LOC105363502 [Ceratosolen solmsi marchali]
MMIHCILLVSALVSTQASMYSITDLKPDHLFVNNMLLRDLIERMGNELAEAAVDSYVDSQESSSGVRGFSDKEIPLEIPLDYEGIDAINPKTNIRDQEYLQHSSLWSHQQLNNYKNNNRYKVKPGAAVKLVASSKSEKTENQLPAYCTPPNPCPVEYNGENNCLVNFKNTAAFSRDYQSAQDCMCDSEHMLNCPSGSDVDNNVPGVSISSADFDQIVERFQDNPYFRGEKLPIAAKKGINVGY